jgi:hypothetical protein
MENDDDVYILYYSWDDDSQFARMKNVMKYQKEQLEELLQFHHTYFTEKQQTSKQQVEEGAPASLLNTPVPARLRLRFFFVDNDQNDLNHSQCTEDFGFPKIHFLPGHDKSSVFDMGVSHPLQALVKHSHYKSDYAHLWHEETFYRQVRVAYVNPWSTFKVSAFIVWSVF